MNNKMRNKTRINRTKIINRRINKKQMISKIKNKSNKFSLIKKKILTNSKGRLN